MISNVDYNRLPRVLLLYCSMIPSIRLCGHGQMQILARDNVIEYRFKMVYNVSQKELRWADIVLLGRLDGWYEYRLVKALKECGKYLIYIMDDDLLDIPAGLSVSKYYQRKDVKSRIQAMIDVSEAMLSTSWLLLEKYGQGKAKILVNGFAVKPVTYASRTEHVPIRIGFAGSMDRQSDVEAILCCALRKVKERYGDRVSIEFFGVAPAFASEINAVVIPYIGSYDRYRDKLNERQWDIGLAPMADTSFHRKKYYNKFIEYAAAGAVGIFSAVEPYLQLQQGTEIGIFCENRPDEWYQAICLLIENTPLRERLRRNANEYVREKLTDERAANALKDGMKEILRYRAPQRYGFICLEALKLVGLCQRGANAIYKYKWRTPQKLWEKLSKS